MAQTVTVGAQGTLTAIGLQNISCPSLGPVTVEIQRLTLAGLPDGTTIASGSATANFSAITVSPTVDLPIDARFAFIISSPTACTFTNAAVADYYNGGDAYVDAGSGWVSLFSTDGRYDLPSFGTLLQPAMNVAYLNSSRASFGAALLNNGKVLLAGGGSVTAEVFDPVTNSSAFTTAMSVSRQNHTVTLLADGKVLVAGGRDSSGNRLSSADVFDPSTGNFTPAAGTMTTARENHTATRLNDGRVLIAGGLDATGVNLQSAEIYNPVTGGFSALTPMTTTRQSQGAVLLGSGRVLIVGGFSNGGRSAELFDPATNTFSSTLGAMAVGSRGVPTATLLTDGRVLITGGYTGLDVEARAELYDPSTDSFALTAGPMTSKRYQHTATLLADGSVLIAGGDEQPPTGNYSPDLATTERFIPATNTFVPAGGLEARRRQMTATRLPNDTVFIAGGFSSSWLGGNAGEFYDVTSAPSLTSTSLPDGQIGVAYPSITLAATGGTGTKYHIDLVSGVLPTGLNYNGTTFTFSGTPAAGSTGVYPIAIRVTDSAGHSNVQTLTIRIAVINVITTAFRVGDAALGKSYDVTLTASGTAPFVWSLAPSSSLPPGLSITNVGGVGHISGTPTQLGFLQFLIREVDQTGQVALKPLAINVLNPLVITTTALPDGVLFEGFGSCIGTSNGVGNRTYSVVGGSLPPGLTLNSSGCFSGSIGAFGNFSFTVQVADSESPPEVVTQPLGISISTAVDQSTGSDSNQPFLSFGGPGAVQIAERVTTGITGMLQSVRIQSLTAPIGTHMTAQIQGLTAAGAPDGHIIASGTVTLNNGGTNITQTIPLGSPMLFAADEPFALVFSADQTSTVHPQAFDGYGGGDAYVFGAGWQTLSAVDGRYDIPFATVVTPAPGLGPLSSFRGSHTATLLANGPAATNGKVLIVGGHNVQSAELYDPATGTSTPTGGMNVARREHTATLLNDGTVLITGGWNQPNNSPQTYLSSVELYHPDTGTFELLPATMSSNRAFHTATTLANGLVLIAGGQSGPCCSTDLNTAEIYTPGSRTFVAVAATMTVARRQHTATRLNDNRVVIAGGWGTNNSAQSVRSSTRRHRCSRSWLRGWAHAHSTPRCC